MTEPSVGANTVARPDANGRPPLLARPAFTATWMTALAAACVLAPTLWNGSSPTMLRLLVALWIAGFLLCAIELLVTRGTGRPKAWNVSTATSGVGALFAAIGQGVSNRWVTGVCFAVGIVLMGVSYIAIKRVRQP